MRVILPRETFLSSVSQVPSTQAKSIAFHPHRINRYAGRRANGWLDEYSTRCISADKRIFDKQLAVACWFEIDHGFLIKPLLDTAAA
jgi:hypothetical protein